MGLTKITALLTLVIELAKAIGGIVRIWNKEQQNETQETLPAREQENVQPDGKPNP